MTGTPHHAVGVLVTNRERTRFWVQQKDQHYPVHPRDFSCFGGAIEPGETPAQALVRELGEEVGEAMAVRIWTAAPRELLTVRVEPTGFDYTLFEVVVEDRMLDTLAEHPVLEGERGVVVERAQLGGLAWVWGLEQVVAAYLGRLKQPPVR